MTNVCSLDLLNKCTGCLACFNICPVNAISVRENKFGFYNPYISGDCINCQKCLKVCQIKTNNEHAEVHKAYACKNTIEDIRMKSSSGGLFPALCTAFMSIYGETAYVVGALWTKELVVEHQMVRIKENRVFSGSKYVQSYMGSIYQDIASKLKSNEWVMFSGTGCQCQALKLYLEECNISTNTLFLVDIVCHGVPSGKMWKEYLNLLEMNCGDTITSYSFRDKSISWHGINPCVKANNQRVVIDDDCVKSYGRLFGNLSLNPACHECKYANLKRVGDITLGDYWGVEKYHPEMDDRKGVSLCLVNSSRGRDLFAKLQDCETVSLEDNNYSQPNLVCATPKNARYKRFWKDYEKKGYSYVAKKYTVHSKLYILLRQVYKRVRGK